MAQLVKSHPEEPHRNRILGKGDLVVMVSLLNDIETQIKEQQLRNGTFTEFARLDDLTLNTCIYKNIDTDDEETFDVNYIVFP